MLLIVSDPPPSLVRVRSRVAPGTALVRALVDSTARGDELVYTTPVPVPVPVNSTYCVEGVVLDAIDKYAIRDPSAVGVNVTCTIQLFPDAKDEVQVVVSKSPELVPMTPIVPSVIVAPLLFCSTTVCAADVNPTSVEGKLRLDGPTCNAYPDGYNGDRNTLNVGGVTLNPG